MFELVKAAFGKREGGFETEGPSSAVYLMTYTNTVRLSELLHLDGNCLHFKRLSRFLPKTGGADVSRSRRTDLQLEMCFKEKQEKERSGPLCLCFFFMAHFLFYFG